MSVHSVAAYAASARSIVVDREVLLKGTIAGGTATVIARMPDGGFVIAGDMGRAWAARVNVGGEIQWQFLDSQDESLGGSIQSQFNGAVMLADSSILLCGRKYTKHMIFAFITILASDGRVIEKRYLSPNEGRESYSGSFSRCLRWGDGVALIGGASNGKKGVGWLMKLDKNGRKEWEIVNAAVLGTDAVEMADHNLVLTDSRRVMEIELTRLDQKGEVLASQSFRGTDLELLRSTEAIVDLQVVIYGGGSEATLHTLDSQLHEVAPPKRISAVFIEQGCGYVLRDKSAVLFGYEQKGGDAFTAPYTATIARVGVDEEPDLVHVLEPYYESFTVRGAVPVSAFEFVAVRDRIVVGDKNKSGIVLFWVKIK